ncbi:MAG: nuclease domain-containing protein [Candidatus Melainabacteria bacterium]|nr:nuclease domain-containing protein [Candidatus Melainabacteria bacterium]
MESPPSSSIWFYDLHDRPGAAIPGPVEARNCGIGIEVPAERRFNISLKVGGAPLPVLENGASVYSEWPPCGPGHYELLLEFDNVREQRTITIMPRNFAESDLASLIHDLTNALPYAIASQLNQCGAQLGALPAQDQVSALENEYFKLRGAIAGANNKLGMLQILPILQRECHQVLSTKLELRSVNKLRRPDISKLPQAISIPGNVVTSQKLYQMFDVTVHRSYEAYENRLVKAYVIALRSRVARLQAELKSFAPSAMATDLDTLANEFHLAYMRAGFLREVKNPSLSSLRITMVLLKNPAYRAVLEGYLALNSTASVALDEPALYTLPLNHFPYLYQRWVNLKVLSALLQVGLESGFRCVSHHWVKSNQKSISIQVMNDGHPAVQLSCPTTGRLVSFVPWSATGGTENISGQNLLMGAAVTIETHGKPVSILLFDPKYWVDSRKTDGETSDAEKTNAEKTKAKKAQAKKTTAKSDDASQNLSSLEPHQEDIDRILRYRDTVKSSDRTSEIHYAAILYPGQTKQIAVGLEALPAHPSDGDDLGEIVCAVLRRYLA